MIFPDSRVHPCSSVVGIISRWQNIFLWFWFWPLNRTELHWTKGVCFKQLQQDLVYNNINNFVQQQFRGGTTHPHGRDCFYCWFFIFGIVEIYIPLSARCVVASGGVPDEPRGRMGCFARVVGFMLLLLLPCPVFSWDSLDFLSPFGRTIISASVASKEVKFMRFSANPCSSVGL